MAESVVAHFHNEPGVAAISIGVKEFMCVGALPPHDHPHVFLDIGEAGETVCPYCSTHYRYRADLGSARTDPAGHVFHEIAAPA